MPDGKLLELFRRNENRDFHELVKADPDITSKLSGAEIDRTFSLDHYLRNVDQIFARLGIT